MPFFLELQGLNGNLRYARRPKYRGHPSGSDLPKFTPMATYDYIDSRGKEYCTIAYNAQHTVYPWT